MPSGRLGRVRRDCRGGAGLSEGRTVGGLGHHRAVTESARPPHDDRPDVQRLQEVAALPVRTADALLLRGALLDALRSVEVLREERDGLRARLHAHEREPRPG